MTRRDSKTHTTPPKPLGAAKEESGTSILNEKGKGREEKACSSRMQRKEEQDNSTTEIKT